MKNRAGKYTTPGLRGISGCGLDKLPKQGHGQRRSSRSSTRRRATALAYPICTFTYMIVPTSAPKAADLRKLIYWAVTQGQKSGPKLLFQPLPKRCRRSTTSRSS